jgi:hypothetical protein
MKRVKGPLRKKKAPVPMKGKNPDAPSTYLPLPHCLYTCTTL